MKLNQLENIEHLDEAPQGMFKRAGLKVKSAFGSDTAKGELQTGQIANKLKGEYMQFVGRTAAKYGNKPTTQTLLAFLNKKGIDTKEVAGMIDKELQALAPQQQAEPQAEPEKVEPEVGSDSELDKLKPQSPTDSNNPLAMNKKDNVNIDTPVVTKRKKTGGRQKGGLANTKSAIYQRNRRAKKNKQLELPLGNSMYSEESQRYRKNFERIDWSLKEDAEYFSALKFMGVFEAVIPTKVLDKVLNQVAVNVDMDDLGGMKPSANPINAEPDSGDDNAQTGSDGSQQKKGGGLLKGIGKAIGGVVGKAKDGMQAGLGDNPENTQGSKIFDPDEEEGKMVGSLNYQNISKEFPGIDATVLRRSMSKSLQNKALTKTEHETMSAAMKQLLQKDPKETVRVLNLFKMAKKV